MKTFMLLTLVAYAASQDPNIVEKATQLGATTLVEFVKDAGLADTLATGGPFTVFAPTNQAFSELPPEVVQKLKNDKQLLEDVLLYHVTNGKVLSTQLKNELLAPSLLKLPSNDYANIRINIYQNNKVITADGSPVTMPDQMAKNGVIHVVDRVLFPIPTKNIPGEVAGQAQFSTLLKAVEAAGLVDTLAGGPFTVFAPPNEAFDKLPAGTLDKLLANKTALTEVLTYHVVSGTFFSRGLTTGSVVTVDKKPVMIKVEGNKRERVLVNDIRVVLPDLAVTNGVIHVVESVLLPPNLRL